MGLQSEEIGKLVEFFSDYPDVQAAYVFGSQADGTAGPKSDIDLAVLCKRGLSRKHYGELQLELAGKLSVKLGRDDIDLIMLNTAQSSELKFAIVQDGVLLLDRSMDLAEYECHVRHEYFDHLASLRMAGLSKA